MTTFTMPSMCAKCGCDQPTETWQIQRARVSISPWTILSIFARRIVYNTRTVTFTIPLCGSCKREMTQLRQMRTILQVLGVLIFVGLLVVLVFDNTMTQRIREYILYLGGVIALLLIVGAPFVVPTLGSFDGQYFRFSNKAFQERFASLNPRLVRRR